MGMTSSKTSALGTPSALQARSDPSGGPLGLISGPIGREYPWYSVILDHHPPLPHPDAGRARQRKTPLETEEPPPL
ncbi:hypothetical protein, partial [Slackia heliotrinireducens]|uniref:hypothetical protein n=1 Tax=Slackia heliotrinireducens TaxID=84110 RepID=UPI003314E3F7